MHDHLHPREVGLIRMLPVVIWSKDDEISNIAKEYVNGEFGEYINLIELESISGFEELKDLEEIENLIDKYNFHVIRIEAKKAELILIDDSRFEEEYEGLEKILDNFGRKLIAFYHKSMG